MPVAVQGVLWGTTLDLLKAILGVVVLNYLTVNGPELFDQALLSLKETFEPQYEKVDANESPLSEEVAVYQASLDLLKNSTVTEILVQRLPAFGPNMLDLPNLHEADDWSQEHVENASYFPPYTPLPSGPVRSASGTSLVSAILSAIVHSLPDLSLPAIKSSKIDITLAVTVILLLTLAVFAVRSRMQDKKHIRNLESEIAERKAELSVFFQDKKHIRYLEREIVARKAEISALSERLDKLQEKDQERDQHSQTLIASREEAEARASETGRTLSTLQMELEEKDEAHKTQLSKLHRKKEKLQEDYKKELQDTLNEVQSGLDDKVEAYETQFTNFRRDAAKLRKDHENELHNTKTEFKNQCNKYSDELRASNVVVCQLQTEVQSLRNELYALQGKQEETAKFLNAEQLCYDSTTAQLDSRTEELSMTRESLRTEKLGHVLTMADLESRTAELNIAMKLFNAEKLNHSAAKAELELRRAELVTAREEKVTGDSALCEVTTELQEMKVASDDNFSKAKTELENAKKELEQMRSRPSEVTSDLTGTSTLLSTTQVEEAQTTQCSTSGTTKRKHDGARKNEASQSGEEDGEEDVERTGAGIKDSTTGVDDIAHNGSEAVDEKALDGDHSVCEGSEPADYLSASSPASEVANLTDQPKAKPFTYVGDEAYAAMSHPQRRKYNKRRKAYEAEVERSRAQSGVPSNNGSDVQKEPNLNPFAKDFIPGGVHKEFKIVENGLVKPKEPKGARRPGSPRANGGPQNTNSVRPQVGIAQSRFAVNHGPSQTKNGVRQQANLEQSRFAVHQGPNQPRNTNSVQQLMDLGQSRFAVTH